MSDTEATTTETPAPVAESPSAPDDLKVRARQLVLAGADYIEKYGLTQREFVSHETGGACMQGSFRMALGLPLEWFPVKDHKTGEVIRQSAVFEGMTPQDWAVTNAASDIVRAEIMRRDPKHVSGVIGFNDREGRTKEEVVELMRAAAAAVE